MDEDAEWDKNKNSHLKTAVRKKKTAAAVYDCIIKYPGENDVQIGNRLGYKKSAIGAYRKKLLIRIDVEVARALSGQFLTDYGMAVTAIKKEITNLQKSRDAGVKTIKLKDDTITVPFDDIDKNNLSIQVIEAWKDLIFFARQGEAVEIMKAIRDNAIAIDNPKKQIEKTNHTTTPTVLGQGNSAKL